jgi:NitT/TauT family transport system substrate-binding protein
MPLVTYKDYKSICDFKPTDKIGAPSLGAVQAVTLQMALKEKCGDAHKLDKQIVGMAHPQGLSNLFAGNISAHIGGPPYSGMELKHPRMRELYNSYDTLGSGSSFTALIADEEWAKKNPKVHLAVFKAFAEAEKFVQENKREAVKTYIAIEKPKNQTEENIMDDLFNITYSITPRGFENYSNFMFEEKLVKNKRTWEELTFDLIHNQKGN